MFSLSLSVECVRITVKAIGKLANVSGAGRVTVSAFFTVCYLYIFPCSATTLNNRWLAEAAQ